jgi:hypothetical protein
VSAAAAVVFDRGTEFVSWRCAPPCGSGSGQQSGAGDSGLKEISRRRQHATTNPPITVGRASSRVILGEDLSYSFEFILASCRYVERNLSGSELRSGQVRRCRHHGRSGRCRPPPIRIRERCAHRRSREVQPGSDLGILVR